MMAAGGSRLSLRGVSKSFGGTQALRGVSLDIAPGEVHALTPDEGAELLRLTGLAERAPAPEYAPQGVNYGINVGRIAGAGVPG